MSLQKLAQSLIADGLSIIPINDKKVPTVFWKQYIDRLPTAADQLEYRDRIGLVCGRVSGNIEVIDVEDIAVQGGLMDSLYATLDEHAPGLYDRMVVATTPSGGFHLIYKCDVIQGNLKLAMKSKTECLMETRGEGGYIAIAPTPGYAFIHGSPREINRITPEERVLILETCRSLNEYFAPVEHPAAQQNKPIDNTGLTPWADFDQRADISSFLVPLGWKKVGQQGTNERWRRPGKGEGHSATWEVNDRFFYMFSSSSELENGKAYKASVLYAKLCHNGDISAANSQIYKDGYGDRVKQQAPTQTQNNPPPQKEKKILKNPWSRANDHKDRLLETYRNGKQHGESTGLDVLDPHLRVRPGFLYCFTGWPQSGKTTFLNYLIEYQARVRGRKVALYSPESYPIDELIDDLIHVHAGKSVDKKYGDHLSEGEYLKALNWVHENFYFVDFDDEEDTPDAKRMIEVWTLLHEQEGVEVFVGDPYNSMQSDDPNISQELKKNLTRFKRFTSKRRVITFLVEHPKTPQDPNEFSKIPNHRNLYGGTMWWNKIDIGVSVHRLPGTDKVTIHVWKVKNQKLNGKPGDVDILYDYKSCRYFREKSEETQTDFKSSLERARHIPRNPEAFKSIDLPEEPSPFDSY